MIGWVLAFIVQVSTVGASCWYYRGTEVVVGIYTAQECMIQLTSMCSWVRVFQCTAKGKRHFSHAVDGLVHEAALAY